MRTTQADFRSNKKTAKPRQNKAFFQGFTLLGNYPLRSLLAILLVSFLFALSIGVWVLYKNIQTITQAGPFSARIIVYLTPKTTSSAAQELQQQIRLRPDVQESIYISPQQGIKELVHQFGFSELFAKLPTNPLPAVITVLPSPALNSPVGVENLVNVLRALPQVSSLQLNLDLIKQQYMTLTLWKKAVYVLEAILISTVFLGLFNVMQFFFVSAPKSSPASFFYSGLFLSLLSVLIGIAFVILGLRWVAPAYYGFFGQFPVGLDGSMMGRFLVIALVLGASSTWLASRLYAKMV